MTSATNSTTNKRDAYFILVPYCCGEKGAGREAVSVRGVPTFEYENVRRVCYEDGDEIAVFVPVCPKCGRFVKADKVIRLKAGYVVGPNATCKRCGPVEMHFEGWFSQEELKGGDAP